MTWASDWWLSELERDPSYGSVVTPLLLEILAPRAGLLYLDLGCGEGQTMRALVEAGITVIGCDLDETLLPIAAETAPVVRCDLPELTWLQDETIDGAYASLVVEHLEDATTLFREARRVIVTGGVFAIVVNHPVFAAPASGPIVDPDDGEVLWRWGRYLSGGRIIEPVGESDITFYERPLAELLNMAAGAGWSLEHTIERGIDQSGTVRQEEIPRLFAARWVKQ